MFWRGLRGERPIAAEALGTSEPWRRIRVKHIIFDVAVTDAAFVIVKAAAVVATTITTTTTTPTTHTAPRLMVTTAPSPQLLATAL